MESTIKIFNYVGKGEFEQIYEYRTNLLRECDYSNEGNHEEISELLGLLVKKDLSLPKEMEGVLIINNKFMLGIKSFEEIVIIDNLDTNNLDVFMEWYNLQGDCENNISEHKESLQEAIKILEAINKPELSYAVQILTTKLDKD